MEGPEPNPKRQQEAREYARRRYLLLGMNLALSGLILSAFAFTGLSMELKLQLAKITSNRWGLTALYFLAFSLGYGLILAPLSLYRGYLLPRQYGLTTQRLAGWLADEAKGVLLGLSLGLGLVELLYFLLHRATHTWWLWLAGAIVVLNVILAHLAPVLIIPLFFRLSPLEDPGLRQQLQALIARAGARVRGIYTIALSQKTTVANAALVGWGNTRRILLADTLYERFTPREIGTILAHELGHHLQHDLWLGMAVEAGLVTAASYLANLALRWAVARGSYSSLDDISTLPLLALVGGILAFAFTPLINAFSRWCESRADEYALELTGDPAAFVSAMTKLAEQNLAEMEPPGWIELLLHSHPSIGRRIQKARAWQEVRGVSDTSLRPPEARREYPQAPMVGVGVAVVREGKVLLIQRAREPLAGQWSLPGGVVRLGEQLAEAAAREVQEECGLEVRIEGKLETVERIVPDEEGHIRYHYVIVDFWATALSGEAKASSDAKAVRWVGQEELGALSLTPELEEIIRKALSLGSSNDI